MVTVMEEPDLPTFATIRIARGNLPGHILSYKPVSKSEAPDFTICWQCALALRMYECPPDERFLIVNNEDGNRAMDALMMAPNSVAYKYQLSGQQLETFKQQLLAGVITHLRSVPIGLRVSDTLTIQYPELLDLEESQVEQELAVMRESLSDSVREMMPAEVYDPTLSISAAYALFWAERLERPTVVNPFHLAGFDKHGQKLLDIYNKVPNDPINDTELIDRWADYLKIRSWYSWLPYEAP